MATALGWRDRLRLAPWWVDFLISALVFGGVLYVTTRRSVLPAVITGLLFAGLTSYRDRRGRQRERWASGCPDERSQLALEASLKAGEIPADPSRRGVLLALINRRRARLTRAQAQGPPLLLVLAAGSAFNAFQDRVWWVGFIGFIGLAVWGSLSSSRDLKRLQRHEDALLEAGYRVPG